MLYIEQTPSARLRPWIRSFWYCSAPFVPHSRERVLPNGCIQVVINLANNHLTDCEAEKQSACLSRAIVVGARGRFEIIDTRDLVELAGVVIEPGAFASLFRERADLFFERSVPLLEVLSKLDLQPLIEAATPGRKLKTLEALLETHTAGRRDRPSFVDAALCSLCERQTSVRDCARSLGKSERWLSRCFREEVGASPKLWSRIQRFQTAVHDLHKGVDVPWTELALQCGYYDQAHFINDFREFSGINPTTYSHLRARWQNHVAMV